MPKTKINVDIQKENEINRIEILCIKRIWFNLLCVCAKMQ